MEAARRGGAPPIEEAARVGVEPREAASRGAAANEVWIVEASLAVVETEAARRGAVPIEVAMEEARRGAVPMDAAIEEASRGAAPIEAASLGAVPMDAANFGAVPMVAASLGAAARDAVALTEVAKRGATFALRAADGGVNLVVKGAPMELASRGAPVAEAALSVALGGANCAPLAIAIIFDTGARPALLLRPKARRCCGMLVMPADKPAAIFV